MEKQEKKESQQTSMFLELEGIDGGSKVKGYEKQFDVIGMEHGISYPTQVGDIPTEEKESLSYKALANYELFKVKIRPNYTYTQVIENLQDSIVIKKAMFTALESNVEILKIEFENVQIRDFTMTGKQSTTEIDPNDTEKPNEYTDETGNIGEISFSYDSIKFTYTSTNKELGSQGKAMVETKLDVYRG